MEIRRDKKINFNKPFIIGKELEYIAQAVERGRLAGGGFFTQRCHAWMKEHFSADSEFLLTHSCTGALEMAALLANIAPGDEVIMPSYTFVSTANAFVLQGASPVWCDIRPDTLNMDPDALEQLVSPRTKAIVPVHYAGVACEMERIMAFAEAHGLMVIEDAAQGVQASYKGRFLGTLGHLGAFSFHETKNYISGEGGALVVNDPTLAERADILWNKGTNRSQFFKGKVDKYTWVDVGSSFLPSELVAAFLFAQLEQAEKINRARLALWDVYYELLRPLEEAGRLTLPVIPHGCRHNAHMFYILLNTPAERDGLMAYLDAQSVRSVFHYVPLHTSPMGRRRGVERMPLPVTEDLSARLLRLPCYYELTRDEQGGIAEAVASYLD